MLAGILSAAWAMAAAALGLPGGGAPERLAARQAHIGEYAGARGRGVDMPPPMRRAPESAGTARRVR